MRWALLACVVGFSMIGCSVSRKTETKRSATEQLMLSAAADRATAKLDFSSFADKKTHLDFSRLECVDEEYVMEAIRERMIESGALLVASEKEADVTLTARSGGLGTDSSEFMIGIPSIPIIIPAAGSFQLPELAIFKLATQTATAKIRMFGLDSKVRRHISSHSAYGKAYYKNWVIFFIPFSTSDIPEKSFWMQRQMELDKEKEEKEKAAE